MQAIRAGDVRTFQQEMDSNMQTFCVQVLPYTHKCYTCLHSCLIVASLLLFPSFVHKLSMFPMPRNSLYGQSRYSTVERQLHGANIQQALPCAPHKTCSDSVKLKLAVFTCHTSASARVARPGKKLALWHLSVSSCPSQACFWLHAHRPACQMQGTFFLLEKLKLTVVRRLLMRCCLLYLESCPPNTANPHHFPLGMLCHSCCCMNTTQLICAYKERNCKKKPTSTLEGQWQPRAVIHNLHNGHSPEER